MPNHDSPGAPPTKGPLLLSVDFEDWHQLAHRRLGITAPRPDSPALARQTKGLLDLLDQLPAKATFFVLGMAARAHPDLVQEIAERGHEIGCHGDRHVPVFSQSPDEFAADLRAARTLIETITGQPPIGYRAPEFSITRECSWAYGVLAAEGFAYDASQHDSPRHPARMVEAAPEPHLVDGQSLWEFPVAVWAGRYGRLPVGGPSYWALMPTRLVLHALEQAGPMAGLYLHPYELDPEPLSLGLSGSVEASLRARARLRAAQRNLARRRTPHMLRAIASMHRLIPYGEAHVQLARRSPAGS